MNRKYFLAASLLFSSAMYAQQPPVRLSWAGELNCERCPLDSVIITNKSNGEKVVFHYPDTVYTNYNVGITPVKPETKTNLKTYPNPFSDKVQVDFSLSQSGEVDIMVSDLLGREIIRQSCVLEKGTHSFKLSLPHGIYTLNLQTAEGKSSARLLSEGESNTTPQIVHIGTIAEKAVIPKAHKSNDTDFPFEYGDTLIMQGFISDNKAFQFKEEHIVPLIEDAHITFAFFNELAFKDTSGIIIIDSLKYGRCYYNSVYSYPPDWVHPGGRSNFIIINTQFGLDSLFACDNSLVHPTIDFSCQTLVLVRGSTPDKISPPYWNFSFIKNCNEDFVIKMNILMGDSMAIDAFYWMVIVNEAIQSKEQVKLIINLY
jgi:hypothetical protein